MIAKRVPLLAEARRRLLQALAEMNGDMVRIVGKPSGCLRWPQMRRNARVINHMARDGRS